MTAARLLLNLIVGTAALTVGSAQAASSNPVVDAVSGSSYLQFADTRNYSNSLPRLETLTLAEPSARNTAVFSAEVFTAVRGETSRSATPGRRLAGATVQLDIFLMVAVLMGLVAFQLRRAQDSLQRPFNSV